MKFHNLLLYWILAASITAQQPAEQVTITPCGLTCFSQNVPKTGCNPTDFACQCASKDLPQLLGACMLVNCTMQDTLILSKVDAGICHIPIGNRGGLIINMFIAVLAVTITLITARLFAKRLPRQAFGPEDLLIVVSLLLALPAATISIIMSSQSFGKHLFQLRDGALLIFLRNFYIAENLYVVVLALTKLSILAFYLRVFQNTHYFRVAVWVTIAFITGSTFIISILTIFQCQPLQYFWNKDLHGVCLNINALAYANTAMSVFQDLVIVALPIPVVIPMNMPSGQKITVGVMFTIGSFGFVVSIIRLQSLLIFGNSIDPSWDYVNVVLFTALELGVAMICSCGPALRCLFLYIAPRGFFSSKPSTKYDNSPFGKKKEFMEFDDEDENEMTKITRNGSLHYYPRRPPGLPGKGGLEIHYIERGADGKFRNDVMVGEVKFEKLETRL